MTRRTGSYPSLIRGVSQQVPQDRLDGQHWEQVNMLSDPVRGLVRRQGTSLYSFLEFNGEFGLDYRINMASYAEYSYNHLGDEVALFYRTAPLVGENLGNTGPAAVALDKSNGLVLNTVVPPEADDPDIRDMAAQGFSGCVALGAYTVFSVNGWLGGWSATQRVDYPANNAQFSTVWVRNGAYSKDYSLTLNLPGLDLAVTVTYTTPASYYPGTLDTSDISASDPDYQKKVNDRVNAYNSAVNEWIGEAAEAIEPNNIAQTLATALSDELDNNSISHGIEILDSVIGVYLPDDEYYLTGGTGGDDTFMRVLHNEGEDVSELPPISFPDKRVRIRPQDGDPYYLIAVTEPGFDPESAGIARVRWEEVAAWDFDMSFPWFVIGTFVNGQLVLASTPERLEAFTGLTDVPKYQPPVAGDMDTSPLPPFFEDSPVTHLEVLQDRLVMVCESTIFMSRPGDYFNWWRESVLDVYANDPISAFALGGENDIIHNGSGLDKTYYLFGQRQIYSISLREVLDPRTFSISVQKNYDQTQFCNTLALGNQVFFIQYQNGQSIVQQLRTGAFADVIDVNEVSQQLRTYIPGAAATITGISSLGIMVLRSRLDRRTLYIYQYLDGSGGERLYDAWHKWEFPSTFTEIFGVTTVENGLYIMSHRVANGVSYFTTDFLPLNEPDGLVYVDRPRLDSTHQYTDDVPFWTAGYQALSSIAVGQNTTGYVWAGSETYDTDFADEMLAAGVPEAALVVGQQFETYFEPTAPYRTDREGNKLLTGIRTLSDLLISADESGGLEVYYRPDPGDEWDLRLDYTHETTNQWTLGQPQIGRYQVRAPVASEIRDHRLRIQAKSWLPLNITSLEFTAQDFVPRR